jgi:uncharacterized protein (TIGR02453 family)
MATPYFTPAFNDFFIDLAANNHKDWFDQNRHRYENDVKKPFERFAAALIAAVKEHDPRIDLRPGDATFRINRDVRFSKDKSPYKLNRSALISPYGRKDATHPGIYVELGPEHVMIAGGSYLPEKDALKSIRTYIAAHIHEWEQVVGHPQFAKACGGLKGQSQKRLQDPELNRLAAAHPVLLQTQFYYERTWDADLVTSPKLLQTIMEVYVAAKPLSDFLEKALDG